MNRSTACSSIVTATVVVGFLSLTPPALASLARGDAEAPRPSSLRIYGAYLPDRVEWDNTHWGFGIAARTTVNSRWGIDFGVARFASSDRSVMPVTVGFAYGPEGGNGLRPWVELGAGYYRLGGPGVVSRVDPAFSSTGNYSTFVPARRPPTHRYNVGGYFGVGFDVPLSSRLGVGTGLRIHGWSDPDALIALQTGLSYGF